jgi:hypothetical protein
MMTRLEFLRSLVGVGASVVGIAALGACGTDTDPGRDDPDPGPDAGTTPGDENPAIDAGMEAPGDAGPQPMTCSPSTVIGSNHGHAMVMLAADLDSTSTKTYQIRGTSDHPHTVTITPAQFATLRANGTLTVSSSVDDDHPHTVVITCPQN